MFLFISLLLAGVVRRQAALGSGRVRRGGRDLRPLGDHLAAGHHPLQQVSGVRDTTFLRLFTVSPLVVVFSDSK